MHLLAPGEAVYSTYMDGLYKQMWGTSMACPMVAGAAALLQSQAMRCGGSWGWERWVCGWDAGVAAGCGCSACTSCKGQHPNPMC